MVRGRLSSRESAFRLGRNLPTMPSIMGGWAAQMGNVGLSSGLSSGRTVNVVVIGFRGLEVDLSTGLALIFDPAKFATILQSSPLYDAVHVTVTNRNGEKIIERFASDTDEEQHLDQVLQSTYQPDGTEITVHSHQSIDSILLENWNKLAFIVALCAILILLTSALALFQLIRLERHRAEAQLIADKRLQRQNAIFKVSTPD